MSYPSVSAEPVVQPGDFIGRIERHPRMQEYVKNGIRLGWGNEQICKVTGAPPEVVSKLRSQHEKETLKK